MNTFKNTVRDQKDYRRQQLIDATIKTISEFGLSSTTVAKVTKNANLSSGIVGFYFKSKEQLLLGTLEYINAQYNAVIGDVFQDPSPPERIISKFIEVSFSETLCTQDKIAVWQAFSGESRARMEFMKICGDHDVAFYQALFSQINQLCAQYPDNHFSCEALTRSLRGLIDSYWLDYLFTPDKFDRSKAIQVCHEFLSSTFPAHFSPNQTTVPTEPKYVPKQALLPVWTYTNPEFLELEKKSLFLKNWLLVGHVNELNSTPGYLTFDAVGEHALIIKDHDGTLRAFHNLCQHRGAKLLEGERGSCPHALTCPFHGWTYKLDGQLIGVPAEKTFPGLNKADNGLVPLDMEVWMGFIFVRFEGEGEHLKDLMSPVADLLMPYDMENLHYLEHSRYSEVRPYNWKVIHDIDNEGYHVPIGHPTLQQLYGNQYIDSTVEGIPVSRAQLNEKIGKNWSVRHYQTLLPRFPHLPEENQKLWFYIGINPNTVLGIYPDSVEFYMTLPISHDQTIYRGASYALPDNRREATAARYLNRRINLITEQEDERFVNLMQQGLSSKRFSQKNLSTLESGVRGFHDYIKDQIPVATLQNEPFTGEVAKMNSDLSGSGS